MLDTFRPPRTRQPVTLSVSVWGTASLSYQWYKDGEVLAWATNAEMEFAGADSDGGLYSVVVSSTMGKETG